MSDEQSIVTHSDPIGKARTNYIHRLAVDGRAEGRFEQVWTRTKDQETFELCCIPFFPFGTCLGDQIAIRRCPARSRIA